MFLGLLFSQNGKFFATIKNAGLLTKNFHLDLGEVWSNKSMHSLSKWYSTITILESNKNLSTPSICAHKILGKQEIKTTRLIFYCKWEIGNLFSQWRNWQLPCCRMNLLAPWKRNVKKLISLTKETSKARLGVSHLRSYLIFTPIQKHTHAMSTFSPKACLIELAFWQGLCIHLGLQNLKARVSFGLYGVK